VLVEEGEAAASARPLRAGRFLVEEADMYPSFPVMTKARSRCTLNEDS